MKVDETVFLTRDELANRWHMSVSTLENWSVKKKGPAAKRFGRRVMYRLSDVQAYEAEVFETAGVR
ncbi:MAG: DNA-binding protein [Mycobacterium sp.]|nr:MAG: DNA-binding protein [Mycobacterium sp.]